MQAGRNGVSSRIRLDTYIDRLLSSFTRLSTVSFSRSHSLFFTRAPYHSLSFLFLRRHVYLSAFNGLNATLHDRYTCSAVTSPSREGPAPQYRGSSGRLHRRRSICGPAAGKLPCLVGPTLGRLSVWVVPRSPSRNFIDQRTPSDPSI